jgi:hypothetical protein
MRALGSSRPVNSRVRRPDSGNWMPRCFSSVVDYRKVRSERGVGLPATRGHCSSWASSQHLGASKGSNPALSITWGNLVSSSQHLSPSGLWPSGLWLPHSMVIEARPPKVLQP